MLLLQHFNLIFPDALFKTKNTDYSIAVVLKSTTLRTCIWDIPTCAYIQQEATVRGSLRGSWRLDMEDSLWNEIIWDSQTLAITL